MSDRIGRPAPSPASSRLLGLRLAIAALLTVVTACAPRPGVQPTVPAAPPVASPPAAAPTATPVPLKPLRMSPERGPVGTTFTISGEGLPAGKVVGLDWATVEGSFVTKASAENVEFYERTFKEKRVPLGTATTDGEGRLTATFTAPEDYGEIHDVYATLDGRDVARGGFRILRVASISPTAGPLGTPITITVTGISPKRYEDTMGVQYDNKFVGVVTAVMTKGTATFQIRAAGPVGEHPLEVIAAGVGTPYLNVQQAPNANVPQDFRFTFKVTEDAGAPPVRIEWPEDGGAVAVSDAVPRTGAAGLPAAAGVSAVLAPARGPILAPTTLSASGLTPNMDVQLFWVTARGNRVSPSGWSLSETPLLKTATTREGVLNATIQVPDDLGGWHVVKLVGADKVQAEVPYFVERSLVGVTPARVKAGEPFTVHIKGVGWTELDNGVAVTYDNGYIGYACGFNSNGDVTMNLIASGGPGTHLIDLYPMVYQGHGKPPWTYQIPYLTFAHDFPGLPLGYRLPAQRLAIEVVE